MKLVFSCSGASAAGEAADHAARLLHKRGVARMGCLSGIGGQVGSELSAVRSADTILAIDGCPVDCAKRTLEGAGLRDFHHLRVTELMGAERDCAPTDAAMDRLLRDGQKLLS